MKFKTVTSLIALACAAPLLAAPAAPSGFRLQPAPTPTPTPQVQGPIDTEGPRPSVPRIITQPTPAPSQTSSPPAASPTGPAVTSTPVVQPLPQPTRSAAPAPSLPRTVTSSTTSAPRQIPVDRAPAETIPDAAPDTAPETGESPAAPAQNRPAAPALAETQGTVETPGGTGNTLWIAGGIGLLILLIGAVVFGRRRGTAGNAAPEIEPPSKWVSSSSDADDLPPLSANKKSNIDATTVKPESTEPPLVAAVAGPADAKPALQLKAQALTLSRSLMNALFSFRLELMNLGNKSISEISIKADLVTAHGRAPISEQVADGVTELPETAFVASIDGRETHEVKGSISLPVNAIRPITQRGATLYVPLLRLRIEAEAIEPIICTFVVGIKPPERGAKLQPFRLDEMAQTYRNIGLRLLD